MRVCASDGNSHNESCPYYSLVPFYSVFRLFLCVVHSYVCGILRFKDFIYNFKLWFLLFLVNLVYAIYLLLVGFVVVYLHLL